MAWRFRYLEEMRNNRVGYHRPVVYLDETYHSTYCANTCWQSETEGVYSSDSKGPRWIIVHARGKMGFIPNAQLIFISQTKSGDYHDEIHKANFKKWVQEKLLPNLPVRSLVVRQCIVPYSSAEQMTTIYVHKS